MKRKNHLLKQLTCFLAAIISFTWMPNSVHSQVKTDALEAKIATYPLGLIRTAIGVTRKGTPIPCFITEDDLDPNTKKVRILLVGGLDGKIESTKAVMQALKTLRENEELSVSAVPCVRPDEMGTEDLKAYQFPPEGNAYNEPENDVAHYLWRWIFMHAPDVVVAVGSKGDHPESSLISALGAAFPDSYTVPSELDRFFLLPAPGGDYGVSPARREIQRRVARSPIEIADELAMFYGHKLDPIMYIPSLAVIGRIRLGELTDDSTALKEAEAMAAPYRTGETESMGDKGNGSTLSGHLIFSELARRTGDEGWKALAKKAADYGFDEKGQPKESMPFHSEMSDSVFMGCAILAEVGALTGEQKYFDQSLRHHRFMQKLCLREDGLYRHSPLDESAWGRGNGFPALGMALSLSSLPKDSEAHVAFLKSYRDHLIALKKHQDPTGAWHQVIDHEESYREFTATCMITFAIVRGIRRGWLDEAEWAPVVEKSWRAIKTRIGPDGQLVDVCTGTGKMKSLRDYFDRTAILGRDDRGGAMALMVSTEMAFWEREKSKR